MKRNKHLVLFWMAMLFTEILFGQNDPNHSLNGVWQFKTDLYQVGEVQQWFNPDLEWTGSDEMVVPGVWDTRNEYADYAGTAWYRRTFIAEPHWQEKWTRLVFEAVYNDVKVWLNSQYLGDHHVGFLPFQFDISPFLRYGAENTLVVQVDNIFKRGAIWNWGGIRRPVWLEVTEKMRLERQHITAVPDLDQGTAQVKVAFQVSNFSEKTADAEAALRIFDGETLVWSSGEKKMLRIAAGQTEESVFECLLPKEWVHLWHFNHPHLYRAELTLSQRSKTIHQLSDRFGIRKIEVDGLKLLLNGEEIRPVGFNLVAEDRTTGNTLPLSRIKADVDMLKELGVNMARLSHLPLPKEFLDYLDEKGIMVFEEVSLWGKDVLVDPDHPLPKYWLEKMIETKFNHPSVIGWSVGNEIGYLNANPKVMEYVNGAVKRAKALDPTRLAVYVSHSADNQETDPVQFSDLIMLNKYGGWGKAVDKAHALHPNKPIFYSEYGKELNAEDPNDSQVAAKEIMDEFRNKPYVIGGSLWTFNDYRSFWQAGPTWSTPPSQNRTWGIVNVFRQKKASYQDFRREYAPVKALRVEAPRGSTAAKITITPRGKLDLPAYKLEGYQLLWTVRDPSENVLYGGYQSLPTIQPGDAPWEQTLSLSGQGAHLRVELLDPQQYSVLDTTIYWEAPPAPVIKAIHTANNRARVILTPVPGATGYRLHYGAGKPDQISDPTINDFIEVGGLTYGKEYHFSVVAVNAAGESQASEVKIARTDEDELPPIIWKTIPADGAFFIGYSVGNTDYLYEVQYGKESGKYDRQIALRNVGVSQIPGLENGETYFYRLRRRMQWGFASEWSDERSVTPNGGEALPAPEKTAVLRQGTNALLLFDPVESATGYLLTVTDIKSGFKKELAITAAQSGKFLVEGLEADRAYTFSLQTLKSS